MPINPDEFGASFQGFLDQMRTSKKPEEISFFERKLREHFDADPATLPVVSQLLPKNSQPNLHVAMEQYTLYENRSAEVLGVAGSVGFMEAGLPTWRPRTCTVAWHARAQSNTQTSPWTEIGFSPALKGGCF